MDRKSGSGREMYYSHSSNIPAYSVILFPKCLHCYVPGDEAPERTICMQCFKNMSASLLKEALCNISIEF